MSYVSRRTFLKGASGTIGAAVITAAATDAQLAYAADRSVFTRGTTLAQVATPNRAAGYARLTAGAGYPLVVREDLVAGKATRDDTREAKASFVQFTDLHVVDAQSPVRFEFLAASNGSAFRPHEGLGSHGAAQLVKRVNDLESGPFSGRTFDCLVSTGDNTDNHEHVELDWFLTVMNGGSIVQNTGASDRWEGVQTGGDSRYYQVENPSVRDDYTKVGFPIIDGFFRHVTARHTSPGLGIPWFSVFGNHDDSVSGVLPSDWGLLSAMYTGDMKFTGFSDDATDAALRQAVTAHSAAITKRSGTPEARWHVTPDERRKPFTPTEFMQAHLSTGGHGFTDENVETGNGYYTFRIADGVTGVALDSTNRAGFTDGSLGDAQFQWLQNTLRAGSSTWYDIGGAAHHQHVDDELFVLFSHHTSTSMGNLLVAPDKPEIRHGGSELVATIKRFPNVIAWVNGHTHENKITPQKHDDPKRSFWEINTASHIDYPQQARIIEVFDNRDGTLSLFATLVESAAPYQASYSDASQAGLASLYREFSYNDIHGKDHSGTAADRNTELLLASPLH